MEHKLGSFEAQNARTQDIYQTFVSDQRLVAVRVGGALDGGRALTVHFGLLGALVGHFLNKRVEKKRAELRSQNESKTLDELLLADKKNFEVRFDALEKAELKKGGLLTGRRAMLVCTKIGEKPLKLQFQGKDAHKAALPMLESAMQGRLEVDPALRQGI
jgi:hypothetical protein